MRAIFVYKGGIRIAKSFLLVFSDSMNADPAGPVPVCSVMGRISRKHQVQRGPSYPQAVLGNVFAEMGHGIVLPQEPLVSCGNFVFGGINHVSDFRQPFELFLRYFR